MATDGRLSFLLAPSARRKSRRSSNKSLNSAFSLFLALCLSQWATLLVQAAPQSSSTDSGSGNAGNGTSSSNSTAVPRPLGTRAHHGLAQNWMQVNSIYIGFLPDWGRENPIDINRELGKAMAIIGDYVDIYEGDTSLSQMRYHASAILRLQGLAVYAPAIRPRFTLDKWTDQMSRAVANAAKEFNDRGMPVWLRFAWEMNGGWYEYGNDPTNLVNAWRSLTNAVRATTNDTYMLWSPNVRYGETKSEAGYEPYYPGQDYVDIAGLSFYAPGREGKVAEDGAFVQGLSSFYRLYGQQHPIIISETAAPYVYQVPSSLASTYCSDCEVQGNLPDPASLTPIPADADSEVAMKIGWLNQLVGDRTAGRYPNLTAVCFFNHFKYGNEHGGNAAMLADFRSVGGHGETERQFRQIVGNVSAYQGGFSGAGSPSRTIDIFVAIVFASTSLCIIMCIA